MSGLDTVSYLRSLGRRDLVIGVTGMSFPIPLYSLADCNIQAMLCCPINRSTWILELTGVYFLTMVTCYNAHVLSI